MKIKTITCHDVYNAGASLQAYALMKYLQNLGHEVEIIDYKPDYLSNHYRLDLIGNPKFEQNLFLKYVYLIAKMPSRLFALYGKRKRLFDNFKDKYLNITSIRYVDNNSLKENLPEADVYIAGSDQIWNSFFRNGKDPAFYLDFVPKDKIKASYAASFATDEIKCDYKEFVKEKISKFDYISVRELSGLNILTSLDIPNGRQVLDPVFLLDKDEWDSIVPKMNNKDNYILVYDFDSSDKVKKIATNIARKKNYKIYSFFKNDYADKICYNTGPLEFVSLIKNSSFVVSNSFHATAFSIIYNKDFYVVNRNEAINTRMRDLLTSLKMENQLISDLSMVNVENKIDYDKVKFELSRIIESSKKYLDEIVKGYE